MSNDQRRIFLVEPESILAEVTAFRLELLGYHVTVLPSAEEALNRVPVEQPDLVMIDLVLPGLDGASLVERLSSDEATSDIPLMVLSVDADLERVQTLYRVGAKDYLVVPYHMSVLEEKIAKHLAKPRPKREVNVKNSE